MTGALLSLDAVSIAAISGLAYAVYRLHKEQRYLREMLEAELRRALELDITKSYQDLLEEHRKLKEQSGR